MILPGVVGAIFVLLGLSAISILPINWLGAALLLLAFTLFALEAKFTSHGVLAVGGAVCMVLGAVMLIDSPIPEMRIHWSTAIALTVPFAAITVLLLSLALRSRRAKVETGSEGMIGQIGAAITELSPAGQGLCARRILGRGVPQAGRGWRKHPRHGHRQVEAHGRTHTASRRRLKWTQVRSS